MMGRRVTLPLWIWLALALAALAGLPPLCNWGASQALALWQQQAINAHLDAVRYVIGTDVTRWHDPAWQRRAGPNFTSLGVDVVLVDRSGIVYATNSTLEVQRQTASVRRKFRFSPSPGISSPLLTVLVIDAAASPSQAAGHRQPAGSAYLWFTQPVPGVPPDWSAPAAAGFALVLTLLLVAWFLTRSVLRPLAAMSRAAQQIARGDLDVSVPSSQMREVAEVAAALTAMSDALHQALQRQVMLEEERRLFVGAIAHDLRTPLFALRGYLRGLESGVAATPEKVAHYIHACSTRADALENLISELFAYARLEYLDQAPQREQLELGALLGEVADAIRPIAVTKGITLALQEPPAACPLLGDGHLLFRAIQNLLDNAMRYTPPGGAIYMRWHQDGPQLVFQVQDTGPGLDPHDLPHLFAPLYRAETSRNRQTGGAGLGLTIARRILQAHGGDLTAGNTDAGGALFTGTLPGAQAIATPTEREHAIAEVPVHT